MALLMSSQLSTRGSPVLSTLAANCIGALFEIGDPAASTGEESAGSITTSMAGVTGGESNRPSLKSKTASTGGGENTV